jgi:hypothetical protein
MQLSSSKQFPEINITKKYYIQYMAPDGPNTLLEVENFRTLPKLKDIPKYVLSYRLASQEFLKIDNKEFSTKIIYEEETFYMPGTKTFTLKEIEQAFGPNSIFLQNANQIHNYGKIPICKRNNQFDFMEKIDVILKN